MENGTPLDKPVTLLIDSAQLESGEGLEGDFREAAREEIARFEREIRIRGGKLARELEKGEISTPVLLRGILNTVGKKGELGEGIRCVVSVGMLSEGWDANNVTHILGIRAFGTQLLCEQVIGRALRRQSYLLNEHGLFDVEYADALGIPFDFTARPSITPPSPSREVTHIRAVRPDRDSLEIRFPRIGGYRAQLPSEKLEANFSEESKLILTPELLGPAETRNEGIFGEGVNLDLKDLSEVRDKTVLMHLTKYLLENHFLDGEGQPKLYLYGQLKQIVWRWMRDYLQCQRGTKRAQLLHRYAADLACERISAAITSVSVQMGLKIQAIPDSYNPNGSTFSVNFRTTKTDLFQTSPEKSHLNYAVCDKHWEKDFCRLLEKNEHVLAYVKNHNLGFEIPYQFGGEKHMYRPDFICKIATDDEPVHLVAEIKGLRTEQDKQKKLTMLNKWLPGVNALGDWGKWDFIELASLEDMESGLLKAIERVRQGLPAEDVKGGGLLDG